MAIQVSNDNTKQIFYSKNINQGYIGSDLVWSSAPKISHVIPGPDFNAKMKTIKDQLKTFTRSSTPPSSNISTVFDISEAQDGSIVMWRDGLYAYWYSDCDTIYLNQNCSNMFSSYRDLTTLNLSNFDTSYMTNMQNMFDSCEKLKSLNVSSFDTSNVSNMLGVFRKCFVLSSLDLSNWNTSNVIDIRDFFSSCDGLRTIIFGPMFTRSGISDADLMVNDMNKNKTFQMFARVPSPNRPDWTDGTWTPTSGTFILNK